MLSRRTVYGVLEASLCAQTPPPRFAINPPPKAPKLRNGFVFTDCLSGGSPRLVRNISNLANNWQLIDSTD